MTTICWRDGVMCADSLATDDTAIQVCKLAQLPDGQVAGGAGDLGEVAAGLAYLANGGDAPLIPNSCFLYTVAGACYVASAGWPGLPVKGFAAIGSGSQGAMVVMKMGASARDAVAAVSGVDPATGGEIDTFEVKRGKRRRPR